MDQPADQTIETVTTLLSTWGLQIVLQVAGAIAVLFVGRFLCGLARKAVVSAMNARRVEPSLVPFISNIIYYTLLATVVIAVLGIFGIETTSLVAVLGTIGLAVGLALQGTLSNFAAGLPYSESNECCSSKEVERTPASSRRWQNSCKIGG